MARITVLEAQVKELLVQLQRNPSNSSTPPSANPLGAPKPTGKPPTGRKPGGQAGHRGHHRARLPADRVDAIVIYVPSACTACRTPLPVDPGPDDPGPSWHQVAELPRLAAVVTEHQAHARTCPGCGLLNQAAIPAEVRAHVIGPRLAAMMSYLSGRFHLSKRSVRELVEAAFEVPVSLGTVAALEQQTSAALTEAHDQARDAVRDAPVKKRRRDRLEAGRRPSLALDGGDRDGGLFPDPCPARLAGTAGAPGRGDHRDHHQRPLVGLQRAAAGAEAGLLGAPEARFPEMFGAWRTRQTRRRCRPDGGRGCLHALVGVSRGVDRSAVPWGPNWSR